MVALDAHDVSGHVIPTIVVDGQEISEELKGNLIRTIVDAHLHLPDMFEIVFEDSANAVLKVIHIGSAIEIHGGAAASTKAGKLIAGEVTSIEGDYEDALLRTVIRGYDKSHRMQRVTRTRTFLDMTDADVAKKIAKDAKFSPKEIEVDDTRTTHKHLAQVAQTDWDFLKQRAQEIGYETGVSTGVFYFRKASSAGGGSAGGLGVPTPSLPLPGSGETTLTFKKNLIAFRPRLSSSGLVTDVEVRVWDPESAAVVVGSAPVKTVTAKLKHDPAELAQSFPSSPLPTIQLPKLPGMPDLGIAPSSTARLIVDRPLHRGSSVQTAADEVAAGLAEQVGSTFAEAEGMAFGDAEIQPGKKVKIDGVPEEFVGAWVVTNARHTFVPLEGGYRTRFVVSGRHDRSLLGLASLGATNGSTRTLPGIVPAVVTNNNDPNSMGRVKVAFPWLAPSYESDWARVAQYGMGKKWGGLFIPEVGDEVLVGFEFGDIRRPYVLAGVINGKTEHDLVAGAVKTTPPLSQVTTRGFVSRLGNRIVFEDEDQGPVATKSSILIGDKDQKVKILVDKKNGEITIVCDSKMPAGKISIEQRGIGGSVTIKSEGNITLDASAQGKVSIKGGAGVSIEGSPGTVEITGSVVKLN
ncbi:MAG TPA: phage baseplate assembly protein V [Acidimicrobiales bacterium]|jgi:phage protein D|nr:phage baseplate assembly protein V [Acidimicrobiales bacterium]